MEESILQTSEYVKLKTKLALNKWVRWVKYRHKISFLVKKSDEYVKKKGFERFYNGILQSQISFQILKSTYPFLKNYKMKTKNKGDSSIIDDNKMVLSSLSKVLSLFIYLKYHVYIIFV